MLKAKSIKFGQHLRISTYTLIIFLTVISLATYGSIPLKKELVTVRGEAFNVKETRGKYGGTGFEFWLSGGFNKYAFEARGVEYINILSALSKAQYVTVSILTTTGNASLFGKVKAFPVYAIKIDNGPEITYEERYKSWEESKISTIFYAGVGAAIGLLYITASLFFGRSQPN